MELRCPDCGSAEVIDRRGDLGCVNCGASFSRESAFVTLADAEALAEERAACTCDELRGCPQCFERAERMAGALIRDSYGRQWRVLGVGEKDGFPTISGEQFWDRPEEVEVLEPPPESDGGRCVIEESPG